MPEQKEKNITASKSVSRLEQMRLNMKDENYHPDMPPCDAEYIIGYLFEIGPTMAGGMGEAPLSHGEIAAWQSNVGLMLAPWESRFLRALSRDYLSQAQKSEKPDCPPPFGFEERRALVAAKIDSVFG
ncbi:MAG: hypothetical protein ACTS6J_02090 [Burkholderiales bacterium]